MSTNLIPLPRRIETSSGRFTLNDHTSILCAADAPAVLAVAEMLARRMRPPTGFPLAVRPGGGD